MNQSGYTYLPPESLDTLKNMELTARYLVEGAMLGLHRSPYRGFSAEFAEYRKYTPGEPVKYIDWKTFARTDRCYIKCFEEETNLNEYILLDTSASMAMNASNGGKRNVKFHYACYLAGAFLYLAHKQRDAFGLLPFADKPGEFKGCSNSATHLSARLNELEHTEPTGISDVGTCLNAAARMIPRRSLVLVFSDFLDAKPDFLNALRQLVFKQCELILFQVMNADELEFPYSGLVRFRDLETGETLELEGESSRNYYRSALSKYNRKLKDFCDSHQITFETLSTAQPFERALAAYFSKREKMF